MALPQFDRMDDFGAELGDERAGRPLPDLNGALWSVAGALVAFGFVVVGADRWEASRAVGIVLALLVIAGAYASLHYVGARVRPAAVAMLAVGIPALCLFALQSRSTGDVTGPVLAAAPLFFAAWLLPLARFRPVLAGLGLAGVWYLIVEATDSRLIDKLLQPANASFGVATWLLSLLLGLAYLGGLYLLDGRSWHGALATPLAAVGGVAYVFGGFAAVSGLDSELGGVAVGLAGGALAYVGSLGPGRRFTTWAGTAGVFVGVVAFVAAAFNSPNGAVGAGLVIAVFGAALGTVLWFVANSEQRTQLLDAVRQLTRPVESIPAHAPGWYEDPTGRFEYRYHDGQGWTQHVSRAGESEVDPHWSQ